MVVVTQADRPKLIQNHCVIKHFGGDFVLLRRSLWLFYRKEGVVSSDVVRYVPFCHMDILIWNILKFQDSLSFTYLIRYNHSHCCVLFRLSSRLYFTTTLSILCQTAFHTLNSSYGGTVLTGSALLERRCSVVANTLHAFMAWKASHCAMDWIDWEVYFLTKIHANIHIYNPSNIANKIRQEKAIVNVNHPRNR